MALLRRESQNYLQTRKHIRTNIHLAVIHKGSAATMDAMTPAQFLAKANHADLKYFVQEKGLVDEFMRWMHEEPPIARLLRTNSDARKVSAALEEGKKRGYDAAFVADALCTAEKAE